MEVTSNKPTPELNSLIASALQGSRFKERRQREAQSDVQNQVVYFSPVMRIDPETQTVVIQYRDSETGDIKNEYPNISEKMTAYMQASATTESGETAIPVMSSEQDMSATMPPTISLDEHV